MINWIVDVKGFSGGAGIYGTWEISVVRDDNEHGIRSYGWDDSHSKLVVGHSGGPCHSGVHPFVWDKLINAAHDLAKGLNDGTITL